MLLPLSMYDRSHSRRALQQTDDRNGQIPWKKIGLIVNRLGGVRAAFLEPSFTPHDILLSETVKWRIEYRKIYS